MSTTEVMEVEPEINYEADSVEDTYLSTFVFADSSEPTTATISDTVTTTNALVDNDGDNEGLQQQPDHEPSNIPNTFGKDSDIVTAVLRAFAMVDNMRESKKSMLQILECGRDCCCKGDSVLSKNGLVLSRRIYETVLPKNVYPLCHGASFDPLLVSFRLQITHRNVRNLQKMLISL